MYSAKKLLSRESSMCTEGDNEDNHFLPSVVEVSSSEEEESSDAELG